MLKQGSEVVVTAVEDKIDTLERIQNQALRISIGAVTTTRIVAMHLYTMKPSTYEEIKKHTVSIFIWAETSIGAL